LNVQNARPYSTDARNAGPSDISTGVNADLKDLKLNITCKINKIILTLKTSFMGGYDYGRSCSND